MWIVFFFQTKSNMNTVTQLSNTNGVVKNQSEYESNGSRTESNMTWIFVFIFVTYANIHTEQTVMRNVEAPAAALWYGATTL